MILVLRVLIALMFGCLPVRAEEEMEFERESLGLARGDK